jgi:DNA replication initiation complex subunit (GINS family)
MQNPLPALRVQTRLLGQLKFYKPQTHNNQWGNMDDTKEAVLTYETLYEVLRKEKSRDETLSKNDIFSQSERDKLHIQLANVRKILRDIYDIRERKIINMAVNTSRTKTHIVDTAHLLPQEQSLFKSLNEVLGQHRSGIIQKILELREIEIMPLVLPLPETNVQETTPAETPADESPTKHVKFLDTIEQLVGEELEMYGPYAANDEAELPRALAEILISQGKAVEL